MERTDKSITTRQLLLLFFVVNICEKLITVSVLLLKISGRGAVLSLALFTLFDFLMLVAMLVIHRAAGDMTFFEFLERRLTRPVSKIIMLILIFYMLIKLLMAESYLQNFLSNSLFDGVIWGVFLVPVIALYAVMGLRPLKSIGRVGEIFSWFLVFAIVFLFLFVLNNVKIISILPLHGFNASSLQGLVMLPAWFGDYILLLFFMGKVRRSPKFDKAMIIGGIITAVVFFAVMCFVFSAYIDIIHYIDYGKKISSITQISINHLNYGRVDIILYSITMISVILFGALYFFFTVRSTERLLGRTEPNKIYTVVSAVVLYVVSTFLFGREQINYEILTSITNYFVWGVHIVLPLLTLFAALFGRGAKEDRAKRRALAPVFSEAQPPEQKAVLQNGD